ncbi:hypothetical protein DB43_HC00190 [Parachlamydia acanthamoebae]|nr:hypothetical protein DB43_HC00190 [Parachlamydia acanthamoebae]
MFIKSIIDFCCLVPNCMYAFSQRKIVSLGNLGCEDKFCSCATSINDSKQVVGLSELNIKKENNKYSYHAFLWENGSLFDLGNLENDEDSIAYSINRNGDVVGISGNRDVNDFYDWDMVPEERLSGQNRAEW